MTTVHRYHDRILEALGEHGLSPRAETTPQFLRDAVNDLYRYEIRQLRAALLAGDVAKRDYLGRVVALRQRYLLLSIPLAAWIKEDGD